MSDPRTAPYGAVRVSDVETLEQVDPGNRDINDCTFHLVRRHFDVQAFGVNAATGNAGDEMIEPHHEADDEQNQTNGHEELYAVMTGHAVFTVDGEEIDAPAGTIVFLRDPTVRRYATAAEPQTTVLAVGGRPGEAYAPSAWEWYFEAERFRNPFDPEAALSLMAEANERFPGHAGVVYSTACWEALAGRPEDAWASLERAIELDPRSREWALRDDDLVSIRDRLEPGA